MKKKSSELRFIPDSVTKKMAKHKRHWFRQSGDALHQVFKAGMKKRAVDKRILEEARLEIEKRSQSGDPQQRFYADLLSDFTKISQRKQASGWDRLPKGWTKESFKAWWQKMTEGKKHPFTECVKKMKDNMEAPEAFCASAKDEFMGDTKWRGKEASTLKGALIKLAYENKEVRPYLVPLLKEAKEGDKVISTIVEMVKKKRSPKEISKELADKKFDTKEVNSVLKQMEDFGKKVDALKGQGMDEKMLGAFLGRLAQMPPAEQKKTLSSLAGAKKDPLKFLDAVGSLTRKSTKTAAADVDMGAMKDWHDQASDVMTTVPSHLMATLRKTPELLWAYITGDWDKLPDLIKEVKGLQKEEQDKMLRSLHKAKKPTTWDKVKAILPVTAVTIATGVTAGIHAVAILDAGIAVGLVGALSRGVRKTYEAITGGKKEKEGEKTFKKYMEEYGDDEVSNPNRDGRKDRIKIKSLDSKKQMEMYREWSK